MNSFAGIPRAPYVLVLCDQSEWFSLTGVSEAMLRFLFQVFYWRASIYIERRHAPVQLGRTSDYLLEFCNDDHYCSCQRP